MRDKLHLDKLSHGKQVSLFAWLYSMGGDGLRLWLLLALRTWVMVKAKPLDFNGADLYFQYILCSNDEWILAGSAKLRVPSEIKSDKKCDKGNGIYLLSWMQGVKWRFDRCMGAVMEEGKKPIYFFFLRQRKQVAGNWKRRGHVRTRWTVWNSLKLSCCLSLDHLGFWEAEATLGSLGNSFHQRRRHWRGRDDLRSLNLLWQMFLLPFYPLLWPVLPSGAAVSLGAGACFLYGFVSQQPKGVPGCTEPIGLLIRVCVSPVTYSGFCALILVGWIEEFEQVGV